jgi:hypothetical protein
MASASVPNTLLASCCADEDAAKAHQVPIPLKRGGRRKKDMVYARNPQLNSSYSKIHAKAGDHDRSITIRAEDTSSELEIFIWQWWRKKKFILHLQHGSLMRYSFTSGYFSSMLSRHTITRNSQVNTALPLAHLATAVRSQTQTSGFGLDPAWKRGRQARLLKQWM